MNTIISQIKTHSIETPGKIAIIAKDGTIAYSELYKKIISTAAFLKEKGLSQGDKIVLKGSHTISYVVCCYAIHAIGAVLVPIEQSLRPLGIAEIMKRVSAKAAISNIKPENDALFIDSKAILSLCESYSEADIDLPLPDLECAADLLFTTGTTGKSKGVLLSHKNIAARAITAITETQLEKDNIYLIAVPMNHAGGLRKLHEVMYSGSTIIMLGGFLNIKQFNDYILNSGVTSIYLPPRAVQMMLEINSDFLKEHGQNIRFIYTSSDAYPESSKEALRALLPNARLYNGYAGSEFGDASKLEYSKYPGKKSCIGKVNSGVQLITVDENKIPFNATADTPGCFAIKSDMNMMYYLDEPELTEQTLVDGFIYTSDMGYIDKDGFIYIIGRSGDVINIGGLKTAPTEVEEIALRFEGIRECLCHAAKDAGNTPVIRLIVAMKDGYTFRPIELTNHLRQYLEAYKVPKIIDCVDNIPRTYNGKIDRKIFR